MSPHALMHNEKKNIHFHTHTPTQRRWCVSELHMRVLLQGFWNRHPTQQPLWPVTCGPPTAATTAWALQLQSRRLCDAQQQERWRIRVTCLADASLAHIALGFGIMSAVTNQSQVVYCSPSGRRMETAQLTVG